LEIGVNSRHAEALVGHFRHGVQSLRLQIDKIDLQENITITNSNLQGQSVKKIKAR